MLCAIIILSKYTGTCTFVIITIIYYYYYYHTLLCDLLCNYVRIYKYHIHTVYIGEQSFDDYIIMKWRCQKYFSNNNVWYNKNEYKKETERDRQIDRKKVQQTDRDREKERIKLTERRRAMETWIEISKYGRKFSVCLIVMMMLKLLL